MYVSNMKCKMVIENWTVTNHWTSDDLEIDKNIRTLYYDKAVRFYSYMLTKTGSAGVTFSKQSNFEKGRKWATNAESGCLWQI